MQFEVKPITDKNIWENFFSERNEKTFLQSWNWGEFCRAMGEKIWRLGIYEMSNVKCQMSNVIVGVAQAIKVEARRGRFLLIPHGPLLRNGNQKQPLYSKSYILNSLLGELKKIAKQEKCVFIRIAPVWERNEENEKIFQNLGFRTAPMHAHPEMTWEMDLTTSEEGLLAGMRKTTRYLIKQGLKDKDLEILKSQDVKALEIFDKIYQETADRHHFVPFSLKYLKNEFLAFTRDPSVSPQGDGKAIVFLARYKGEYLAAAMIIFWQGIAFYHQGASSQKYPKVPASYVLQWEAMREAKKRGCKTYNFWGLADISSKFKVQSSKFQKHPWAGLTLFKTGFGGCAKSYVKTQDLPLSLRYWLTWAFEKMRKKRRRF